MRDQLLGFLLGALDDCECEKVRCELEKNPGLRQELELLRRRLEPLEVTREDYRAPVGLAERTCAFVAQRAIRHQVVPASLAMSAVAPSELTERRFRWSWSDVVVAAGVFLASALLFFPAIAKSRFDSRVAMCQYNLQQIGWAVQNYTEQDPRKRFPYVPADGNESFAGYFSVSMRDCGLLPNPNLLLCPDSDVANRNVLVYVPTRAEIKQATGVVLRKLQQSAGGSFGFNVGLVDEAGRHTSPRDERRATFAVMADAPSLLRPNGQSESHGGKGQNLWFEDGHVAFVKGCPSGICLDHPFRNKLGVMEAGVDANDAVVAPSSSPPYLRYISSGR